MHEGTKPTQEVVVATLDTILEAVARSGISAPAIVVIGDVVNEREHIRWFDTQPLFGKRVLVTRPAHQAGDRDAPVGGGGRADRRADDRDRATRRPRRRARRGRPRARLRMGRIHQPQRCRRLLRPPERTRPRCACLRRHEDRAIGPQTAAALAARGIRVDLVPTAFVNEAVAAELLAQTQPGERVLVYRAQEARDVLPETLRREGRGVDVVAAYRTRFVDDPAKLAAKAERADIVTFTSSSTVDGFVHNVPDAARALAVKTVAAIGPITAHTARERGIRVDIVADEFTVAGLLRALAEPAAV